MTAPEDMFIDQLKVQGYSLYGVASLFVIVRMYASISKLGWRNLRIDDILMIPAFLLYTGLIATLNIIMEDGGSLPWPVDAAGPLTEEDIQVRIRGSKVVLIMEQCFLNELYILKTCMLVFYTRLTLGTKTQLLVRVLAVFVALCWLASQLTFFTHCRPFSGLWAFPPPTRDCATLETYQMAEGSLNIASDVLMVCVVLPIAFRINMPLRHKLVLFFVLSAGLLVIAAAILTKYFDLSTDWDPTYILWYVRESSLAVCVANMPILWPLLLRWCPWLLRSKKKSPKGSNEPAIVTFGAAGVRRGGRGGVVDDTLMGNFEEPNTPEMRQADEEAEIGMIAAASGAATESAMSPQSSHASQNPSSSPVSPRQV
ncbi:hypothetical protein MCOR14_009985 [Pyricularia oryzae]|nr:hypothetical protein MCOR13_010061 [Pyricularia oryzae]KAI6621659.1 hypothetical protein MCOR14_009985 [Pyricularia oryzae]